MYAIASWFWGSAVVFPAAGPFFLCNQIFGFLLKQMFVHDIIYAQNKKRSRDSVWTTEISLLLTRKGWDKYITALPLRTLEGGLLLCQIRAAL